MSSETHIKKLINNSQRRLQKLKEQQALQGYAAEAHILLEIEDIEAEIKRLQAELAISSNNLNVPSSLMKSEESALDASQGQSSTLAKSHSANNPSAEPPTDFVIVTALEEERDAVLSKLPGYRKLAPSDDDVRVYYSADLPVTFADGSRGVYRVVVMPLLGMGRVQATVATADAIRRWRPRYVLLVGIAGGVAAKEVKLGDILVSDQIVDYELQKLTSKGAQVRWEVHRADARLIGAARNFSGADWQALLTTKRPDEGAPKHHIGPIASGDKVIALGKVLAKYRKVWPAIIGVEMEAAGVATATFQAAKLPGFFMVRGVSDLADEDKNSAGVQNWRIYACDIAASYAIALLKSGPVVLSSFMVQPPSVSEQEIPGAKEISPTVSSVKPSDQKLHPVSKPKSKPSWIQDFSRPQPSLQDSQISTILRGYPLFRSHLAEQELEFLFGNVGCFWSRHPTYATVVSLYPQVVVANTGSGKTAFAHALTQIGDADGKPLENTLPILLSANMRTIKDTQAQIAGALLKFILDNLTTLNDLTQSQKKFLLRFLVSAQETELVKVRLNQILEADKSLVDSIERVETPARFNQTQWPLYARQCLELLGFERAILVVDLNNANAVQLKFWLQNMTRWAAHNLVVKLFLPENLSYPSGELSDSIELLPLTWRENQIVEMVNWRFESLARLTGIRANLEFLFDEGLYLQFLGQAQGNPGRLAQLWRYLFEDHLNFSHTCSTFTLDNFARAVEKLK